MHTREELNEKSIDELKEIARDLKGITVRIDSKKETLIRNILKKQKGNEKDVASTKYIDFSPKETATDSEEQHNQQIKSEKDKNEKEYDNHGSSENIAGMKDGQQIPSIEPIQISAFLIQINKSHLLDYFGSALIYPVNYEERELARSQRETDVQSNYPNHLLISDGFVDEPTEQQVLIEVALTEFDKHNLIKLNERAYLLPYPLPISRVNTIYFANQESQKNSIASAKTFQDAFLPTHLFTNWNEQFEENYINIVQKASVAPISKNLSVENKNKFNRVLGMLAFMKNAEIYYANETCEFAKYSDKYLKVLREINPFFEKVDKLDEGNLSFYTKLLGEGLSKDDTFSKIVRAIYNDGSFRKDIFKQILGKPSESIQHAFKLLVEDQTMEALRAVDDIKQPELVPLIFLFRFRDKEGNDKYAIKAQLPELVNRKKLIKTARTISRANIVLASLGLYYGYRNLPKEEEIELSDEYFASFAEDGKFNIKYKLDNLLDRITIESVYQYCFWDKNNNDFSFLKTDSSLVESRPDHQEGYSYEKISLVESNTVVKVVKNLSEDDMKLKAELEVWWGKVIAFFRSLFKKKEVINNDNILERLSEFVSLHEDGYIPNSAIAIVELINNYESYAKLINLLKNHHLLARLNLDSKELDIWLHNNTHQELDRILSEFK